jgi:hypothetical protein
MYLYFKGECHIEKFKGKQFVSKGAVDLYADRDIFDELDNINDICELCGVKLKVSKSFTKENKAMGKSSIHSSLLIGYGFIADICDENGDLLCNESCQQSNIELK